MSDFYQLYVREYARHRPEEVSQHLDNNDINEAGLLGGPYKYQKKGVVYGAGIGAVIGGLKGGYGTYKHKKKYTPSTLRIDAKGKKHVVKGSFRLLSQRERLKMGLKDAAYGAKMGAAMGGSVGLAVGNQMFLDKLKARRR